MSCAEGILFLDQLRKARPREPISSAIEAQRALSGLATWAIGDFQEKRGSFYFQGYPGYKIRPAFLPMGAGSNAKALASSLQQPD